MLQEIQSLTSAIKNCKIEVKKEEGREETLNGIPPVAIVHTSDSSLRNEILYASLECDVKFLTRGCINEYY